MPLHFKGLTVYSHCARQRDATLCRPYTYTARGVASRPRDAAVVRISQFYMLSKYVVVLRHDAV